MIKNIRHTGLVISDIDKSLQFYEKLLGFKVIKMQKEEGHYINELLDLPNASVTTIKMTVPEDQMLELLYFHDLDCEDRKKRINDIGLTHISLTVSDVAQAYSKLTEKGIKFLSSPQESPDGYAKVAFCIDPDGVFIELVEVLN